MTPVLTKHARERCAEMGISTKVAKRIVQNSSVTYRGEKGADGTMIHLSSEHLDYAVVATTEQVPVIVTVLFRVDIDYTRQGATFIPRVVA